MEIYYNRHRPNADFAIIHVESNPYFISIFRDVWIDAWVYRFVVYIDDDVRECMPSAMKYVNL